MADSTAIETALRVVEPAARLVPERHLRKFLHYLRDHGRCVPVNPHRPVWATRQDLTDADVMPPAVLAGPDDPLLLITTPDDRSLDHLPPGEQLRDYWRLLFQGAVLRTLLLIPETQAAARLARFGDAAIREIRYVLEAEHQIDPEADDAAIYSAFAALYLDLHSFAPEEVADYFPSLPESAEVLAVLEKDLDRAKLLPASRPTGAADIELIPPHPAPPDHAKPDARHVDELLSGARQAEALNNFVRSAILQTQAAHQVPDDRRDLLHAGAKVDLGKLTQRLARVLDWGLETEAAWRVGLVALLEPASAGRWPRAARCLYELQKIPKDLANEVYAVDLVEPIRTLGRRPVKRPLPHAREVMLLLKIRAAHTQLMRATLDAFHQHALEKLFHDEMARLEALIRAKLTPIITRAVEESGLVPGGLVESVARDKLVAELLDRVCERGYLRFGDLRDAIARNQLKMPDLAGPGEWLAGDPLLKADTRLAYDLDGIYRRGEFYLRGLQRGSSLFFGTPWGRVLFLYLIAPFLAAFLTLTFAIELKHMSQKAYRFASKILAPKTGGPPAATPANSSVAHTEGIIYYWDDDTDELRWERYDEVDDGWLHWNFDEDEAVEVLRVFTTSSSNPRLRTEAGTPEEHRESALPQWEPVFVFSVFLLMMFHVRPFRAAFLSVVYGILTAFKSLFWDLPAQALRSRTAVAIRYSAPMRLFIRYLLSPLLVTGLFVLTVALLGASQAALLKSGGFVLAAALIALNSPWGWLLQESVAESLSDGWRIVRVNLIPGIVATFLDWFRRLANWVERQLYEVDEWLRFRGGESKGSLALKAILGLIWFPFAYLARFAFYLLIEPQVNPVKHFPVVTVSHKVILPLAPQVSTALNVSTATALWLLAGIPGIFGFIAWELLSNWKLYAANRPRRLKPAVIGSHGESMRGLLRPGFHSGTVPKQFRKLRRADRQHDHHAAAHHHHELHHVAEGVTRFIERELLRLLREVPEWGGVKVEINTVRFGCQRVVVELAAPDLGADACQVAFENRGGAIAAEIPQTGWMDKLTMAQRETLTAALRGLFDLAAAERHADRDRTPDSSGQELTRCFTWTEWVTRWS